MHMLFCLLCCALTGQTTQPANQWKLVWSDEFDKAGAPDPAKWKYEAGYIRNREKQFYTPDRRENVRVEDGCLIIEARKEHYEIPGKAGTFAEYTSGSIESRGSGEWKYGRIEVRAKIPSGRGMWPAIWMLPPTEKQLGWPSCGEIDIMENVGFDPDLIHGTVHTKSYNHVIHTEKTATFHLVKPSDDFHVYAIEWDENKIDFFVDDNHYFTFKNEGTGHDTWPFDQPFFLKLNSAIGGQWGGQQGVDDGAFPTRFYVDYVRVYQKN